MRFSALMIMAGITASCVTIPIFLKTNISARTAQINNDYSNYLITATKSGIDAVLEDNPEGQYVFATEDKRQSATDAFYQTLIQCFNYDYTTYENLVYYYVPCVFMVDTDGYYIQYMKEYTDSEGMCAYENIITPINKWARTYSVGGNSLTGNTYNVEYHLDDTVKVVYKNRKDEVCTIEGEYAEVYKKLEEPAILSGVFGSYTDFDNERTDIVIDSIEKQLTYYINVHDTLYNQQRNVQYEFTMPRVTKEDWARLVDAPTILSFMQGAQTEIGTNYLNIYALAGSEIEEDIYYVITTDGNGEKTYHIKECSHVTGTESKKLYSMEQAAMKGAYPCPDCIK